MIILIGDVHGKAKTYQKFIRRLPEGQRSIQLGDMGLGFKGVGLHRMSDDHKWFRGNHDNPEKCRLNPNYLGDYGYLPGDSLFWIAGAFSMDREWRTQGVDFWIDEELSYAELGEVINFYEQVKPKFVISHEAPSEAGRILLYNQMKDPYFLAKENCCNSRTAMALQNMFEIHQPKEWVFGHYHVDTSFEHKGTKFSCVAELSTYNLETTPDASVEQRPSVVL